MEHTRSIDLSKLCIIFWVVYHSITNLFDWIALSLLHEARIDRALYEIMEKINIIINGSCTL